MAVRISRALLERILRHAAGSPYDEVCGMLTGAGDEITDAIAASNVAADRKASFEVDPALLFAAIRAERAGGPRIVGHYHSHPGGFAAPSERDAADAGGDPQFWMIVAGGAATLWRSGVADGLHGCFGRVELNVQIGSVVA